MYPAPPVTRTASAIGLSYATRLPDEKKPGGKPGSFSLQVGQAGLAAARAALGLGAGVLPGSALALRPAFGASTVSSASVAALRSTSSTRAIGALSPWRKPNFRMRR